MEIQVLTWRYRYLLRDTGTYSEIQVLTRRYRYFLGDTGTYFEIEVLTCRTGTYLKIKVTLTYRYRTFNSLQGRIKRFKKNLLKHSRN